MKKIRELFSKLFSSGGDQSSAGKWRRFGWIMLGILFVTAAVSLVAKLTVLRDKMEGEIRIAIVAPLSGADAEIGASMQRSALMYADQVNSSGGLGNRRLEFEFHDEGTDAAKAREVAEAAAASGSVLGVLGHWSRDSIRAAGEVYGRLGVPMLSPSSRAPRAAADSEWVFSTAYAEDAETRFLANFVRNVIGEKTVSIIHQEGDDWQALAKEFDGILQRFGTKVVNSWAYNGTSPNFDKRVAEIVKDIDGRQLTGALLILGGTRESAQMLTALRMADVRNQVVGFGDMATNAFMAAVAAAERGERSTAFVTDKLIVTTPVLFDTANETAQNFRNEFVVRFGAQPDWVALEMTESIRVMIKAIRSAGIERKPVTPDGIRPELKEERRQLRDVMAGIDTAADAVEGLRGPIAFNRSRTASPPVQIGLYTGGLVVSALTQLHPIREVGVQNYLEELMQGRALYVNDRFMYKTNVVYTGVQLFEVKDFNLKTLTATLDFLVWFRYRGDFKPEDVVFTNAVKPIQLDKPEKQISSDALNYRSYRVTAPFYIDFSRIDRAFGTHLVGFEMVHRNLNRNNLMYVTDVLGMALAGMEGGVEAAKSTITLAQTLDPQRVLKTHSSWSIDRAWISQEMQRNSTEGNPSYIGYGRPDPDFSQVRLALILKPDRISAREFVAREYFVYIAIFAFVGCIVAAALDGKDRGQFWRAQTMILRTISWPLLLMAGGNLALDYALNTGLALATIDTISMIYDALWWLVPARLLNIFAHHFIWVPLEVRTKRKVPNVVRVASRLVVYIVAFCGIIAFVLEQPITSVLATSGVLAMVIGLAIRANIANVFSGIVLNLEHPFSINDYVMINKVEGKVVDITWRTTRVQAKDGFVVSLPNGRVSEADIHNFSAAGLNWNTTPIFVPPDYDPEKIKAMILSAMKEADTIFQTPDRKPSVNFLGTRSVERSWVAQYEAKFAVENPWKRSAAVDQVSRLVWKKLHAEGIYEAKVAGTESEVSVTAVSSRIDAPAAAQ